MKKCKVCGEELSSGVLLHRDCYDELVSRKANEWFSSSENIPDEDFYLVVVNGYFENIVFKDAILQAEYNRNFGWELTDYPDCINFSISHFMLLPELPVDCACNNQGGVEYGKEQKKKHKTESFAQ